MNEIKYADEELIHQYLSDVEHCILDNIQEERDSIHVWANELADKLESICSSEWDLRNEDGGSSIPECIQDDIQEVIKSLRNVRVRK